MTEDVTMFERIINRIAENSEANRQLRADYDGFQNGGSLGPWRRCADADTN